MYAYTEYAALASMYESSHKRPLADSNAELPRLCVLNTLDTTAEPLRHVSEHLERSTFSCHPNWAMFVNASAHSVFLFHAALV